MTVSGAGAATLFCAQPSEISRKKLTRATSQMIERFTSTSETGSIVLLRASRAGHTLSTEPSRLIRRERQSGAGSAETESSGWIAGGGNTARPASRREIRQAFYTPRADRMES